MRRAGGGKKRAAGSHLFEARRGALKLYDIGMAGVLEHCT